MARLARGVRYVYLCLSACMSVCACVWDDDFLFLLHQPYGNPPTSSIQPGRRSWPRRPFSAHCEDNPPPALWDRLSWTPWQSSAWKNILWVIEGKACLHECTNLFTVKKALKSACLGVAKFVSLKEFAYGMSQERKTHLHDVFYQCLVSANLGSLQSADVFANPGDEGEFGTLAHGITRCDPYKPKETVVIWESRRKKSLTSCAIFWIVARFFYNCELFKNVKCVTIWINHILTTTFAEKSQQNWRWIRLYSGRQETLWKVALEVFVFLYGITRVQITDRFTTN